MTFLKIRLGVLRNNRQLKILPDAPDETQISIAKDGSLYVSSGDTYNPDDLPDGWFTWLKDHDLLPGSKKKIFVVDKSGQDIPPPEGLVLPQKEKETENRPKPVPKKIKTWKKMTAKKWVLQELAGDVKSTQELAESYKEAGHSKKLVSQIKATMSVTISVMRKEGYPIIKIKRGRYGIRKEDC